MMLINQATEGLQFGIMKSDDHAANRDKETTYAPSTELDG